MSNVTYDCMATITPETTMSYQFYFGTNLKALYTETSSARANYIM